MGKNRYVQHKHITQENNKGNIIEVFYHKHYDSEGYAVTKIDGQSVNSHVSYETLENAIKSTENK
jgi:hypothetical protein